MQHVCSYRVLQSLWELLLRMILDAVAENRGVQVEFYNRFQYTVEVSRRSVRFSHREDDPVKASRLLLHFLLLPHPLN